MSAELSGKVAVVTGGGSGIGAAACGVLAAHGATVVVGDVDFASAKARAADINQDAGPPAFPIRVDVSDFGSQQTLVSSALDRFGRIDIFHANAGFGVVAGFENSAPDVWRRLVEVNVLGVSYSIRAALPALREAAGHMVITSSLVGRVIVSGSVYSAGKHAVTALAESLRLEVDGAIGVTCVMPGLVDTPNVTRVLKRISPAGLPLDKSLQADDVARAVLYAVTQPSRVDVSEIVVRPTAHSM